MFLFIITHSCCSYIYATMTILFIIILRVRTAFSWCNFFQWCRIRNYINNTIASSLLWIYMCDLMIFHMVFLLQHFENFHMFHSYYYYYYCYYYYYYYYYYYHCFYYQCSLSAIKMHLRNYHIHYHLLS